MAKIITCQCGAQVRLPEAAEDRKFRCPSCKTGIAISVDATVLASTRLGPGDQGATCPICQSPIAADEFAVTCPKCEQIHHRECWAEVGGCGTYGCPQAPATEKGPATEPPLSAWGDTKRCPVCGETIKAIAVRCRYCHTDFDTVNPLTIVDLHRKTSKGEKIERLQKSIVTLFVLNVIGCLAPLGLILNLAILLPQRRSLAKVGRLHQVLAYSAALLSVVYSILMLLFVLCGGL
jgi:hypothetical protein